METSTDTLKNNAQQAARDAVASASATADQLRDQGAKLLDKTMTNARDAQDRMLSAGKNVASKTDVYVRENPWMAIVISAAAGLLAGMIVTKK